LNRAKMEPGDNVVVHGAQEAVDELDVSHEVFRLPC
jgi:hypothetical protein